MCLIFLFVYIRWKEYLSVFLYSLKKIKQFVKFGCMETILRLFKIYFHIIKTFSLNIARIHI